MYLLIDKSNFWHVESIVRYGTPITVVEYGYSFKPSGDLSEYLIVMNSFQKIKEFLANIRKQITDVFMSPMKYDKSKILGTELNIVLSHMDLEQYDFKIAFNISANVIIITFLYKPLIDDSFYKKACQQVRNIVENATVTIAEKSIDMGTLNRNIPPLTDYYGDGSTKSQVTIQ
jgi:hypothetical protein